MDRIAEPLRRDGGVGRGRGPDRRPRRWSSTAGALRRDRVGPADGERPGEVGDPVRRARRRRRDRGAEKPSPPGPTPKRCWPPPGPTSPSSRGERAGRSRLRRSRAAARSTSTSPETPPRPPSGWWPRASPGTAASPSSASTPVAERTRLSAGARAGWGPRRHRTGRSRRRRRPVGRQSRRSPATDVDAAEIPSLDEVPVLAVAAAAATGTTTFRDVGELDREGERPAGRDDRARRGARRGAPAPRVTDWSSRGPEPSAPAPFRFDSRGRPPPGHGGDGRRARLPGRRGGAGRGRGRRPAIRPSWPTSTHLGGPGAWSPAEGQ